MMEFHVSRASRDKYQFDQVLFSLNGNVIFANFQAARQFAAQINAQKKPGDKGFVSPGQINALGLIDDFSSYRFAILSGIWKGHSRSTLY